jgi:hypothetical protein
VNIKPVLSETAVMSLLAVSVLVSITIAPNTLGLFRYQDAIAQKTVSTATSNFLTYNNSTYGINVQYPSDWLKVSENASRSSNNSSGQGHNIVTFIPQDRSIHALVNIGTANLSPMFQSTHINISSFAPLVIDNIKQVIPGFQLVESSPTTVKSGPAASSTAAASLSNNSATSNATIPAEKIVYTADGPVHKTMAVYAIKGDKAFFISYLTETESIYSSYLPIAQKMIDSFQILK